MMDLPTSELQQIPEQLRDGVEQTWSTFTQQCSALGCKIPDDPLLLSALCKVWAVSRFVADTCARHPAALLKLLDSGALQSSSVRSKYALWFNDVQIDSEADLLHHLRVFRRQAMLRIAWRDIAGWSDLDETLADLSALAEVCVQQALDYLFAEACARWGTPLREDRSPQNLIVLAMGKLGAWELNFSSDIDLIFAYPRDGVLPGDKQTTYSKFYIWLCRRLVSALSNVTADGFVFRVDTRLRPFGDSGPLAMSFSAMAKYYQEHGREWERYALVKSRPIAGDFGAGERLQMSLRPFVYRPYLDFGIFAELRKLKAQIASELDRKDRVDNVKLGPGGIREIEFITQVFQLIRGGRDQQLQERRLLPVLKLIGGRALLPQRTVVRLTEGYRYLRVVEHRLQEFADQQVNDLPVNPEQRLRLAYALGFDDWGAFKAHHDALREEVHATFQRVFASPQLQDQDAVAGRIWAEAEDENTAQQLLRAMGFEAPEKAHHEICAFRQSRVFGDLGEKSRMTLDLLMPMVLNATAQTSNAEVTLNRLLGFFRVVAKRSAYLSLLLESPLALSQLVSLSSASPWIVGYIARDPLLLDELLNPNRLYDPLMKEELAQELTERVSGLDPLDAEHQMLELRYFKQSYVLRVAAADITGAIPLIVVSDYLTDIAEVILEAALTLAWQYVVARHGTPAPLEPDSVAGFGVIAFGQAGSRELSYETHLDVMYVCDIEDPTVLTDGSRAITAHDFFLRLAQRINFLLVTRMLSGLLYQTNTPAKAFEHQGALLCPMDAYVQHLRENASFFELGTLIQARCVAGDAGIAKGFEQLRLELLCTGRDADLVRRDILEPVVQPIRCDADFGGFDIRAGNGGLDAIHRIVRFGVLTQLREREQLADNIETMSLFHTLSGVGFLSRSEHKTLQEAYIRYRARVHMLDLQELPSVVPDEEFTELRASVAEICARRLG